MRLVQATTSQYQRGALGTGAAGPPIHRRGKGIGHWPPFQSESNIRRLAPARAVPLTAEATRVFTEALANPVRPAEPDRRS